MYIGHRIKSFKTKYAKYAKIIVKGMSIKSEPVFMRMFMSPVPMYSKLSVNG